MVNLTFYPVHTYIFKKWDTFHILRHLTQITIIFLFQSKVHSSFFLIIQDILFSNNI